jgi:Cu2+-exporting ATPase
MKSKCQHCGTRYRETDSSGPFCCAGCEQVYELIQEGGLGDFYGQQNGVGLPMKNRKFVESDFAFVRQVQSEAEASGHSKSEAVLRIDGLTCFGCVWLVEHLAKRHVGITLAKVALSSARIHLSWRAGEADLLALAKELEAFGYSLKEASVAGFAVSPLLLRFLLTSVFSINAGIVLGLGVLEVGAGRMDLLFVLLLLVSFLFSLLVGGQVFFQSAWRAVQMGRWHRDLIPVGAFLSILLWCLFAGLLGSGFVLPAALYFTLLPVLLLARWLADAWALSST